MRSWTKHCFQILLDKIVRADFSGYDPYDGLNSRLVRALRLDRIRPFARAFQQVIKRLPINLRPLFIVPRGRNPKGLALCLSALCSAHEIAERSDEASRLVDMLLELRSPGWLMPCWGYNFRWESRLFSLPPYSPNAVSTVFCGEAMLDAWERFEWEPCREAAEGAADFLKNNLNISENKAGRCFSYTTLDHSITHNVNLFVSAYLQRAAVVLKRQELADGLERHVSLTLSAQREDGAWPYGEDRGNEWVDGIHQGFNLIALHSISQYTPNPPANLHAAISNGFRYYLDYLFTLDGLPKYYDDRLYPLDIHNVAVAIVTLHKLRELDDRAEKCLNVALAFARDNLWMERKGLFAYQRRRFYTVRIPFMRWGQCWMLYALARLLG